MLQEQKEEHALKSGKLSQAPDESLEFAPLRLGELTLLLAWLGGSFRFSLSCLRLLQLLIELRDARLRLDQLGPQSEDLLLQLDFRASLVFASLGVILRVQVDLADGRAPDL